MKPKVVSVNYIETSAGEMAKLWDPDTECVIYVVLVFVRLNDDLFML